MQAAGRTASGAFSQFDDLVRQNAGDLSNDPNFIQTVIAGAKAESGLDPNAVQKGGGGRGLWQFDLGGMGKGLTEDQLFDPAYQASKIVPLYAAAYKKGQDLGMQGSQLASYAAGMAERPFDYTNPDSAARRNYATAYNELSRYRWRHRAGRPDRGQHGQGRRHRRGRANLAVRHGAELWRCDGVLRTGRGDGLRRELRP